MNAADAAPPGAEPLQGAAGAASGGGAAAPRAPDGARRPARRRAAHGWFAVLEREFLVATSRGGFVAMRSVVVALVAIVAIFLIGVETSFDGRVDGNDLFLATAIAPVVLCILLAPGLAAPAIASERALDTLPLALAAPVSPTGFVLAKFAARLGAILVPLLGTIPVTATALAFGGPSSEMFLAHACVLLLFAVLGTAAGIWASAVSPTVASAVMRSYGAAILLPLGLLWAWYWFAGEVLDLGPAATNAVAAFHPYTAMVTVFSGTGRTGLLAPAAAVAAFSVLALGLAARRIAAEFAIAARGRRERAPRPLRFENPVLHRAAPRTLSLAGDVRSLGVFLLMTAATWFPVAVGRFDDDEVLAGIFIATWIATLYLLVRSSQTIAPERQRGSLGILLATRISPAGFVDAHIAGLACHAARLLLPAFALAVLAVADEELPPRFLLVWPVATAVLAGIHVCAGLWASATSTTGGRAAMKAIGVVFAASVAWGLLALAVTYLADRLGGREEYWGIPIVSMIPAAWHGMLTGIASDEHWGSEDTLFFWWSAGSCAATAVVCSWIRWKVHRTLADDDA